MSLTTQSLLDSSESIVTARKLIMAEIKPGQFPLVVERLNAARDWLDKALNELDTEIGKASRREYASRPSRITGGVKL